MNKEQQQILDEEVATDPLGRGYSTMSDLDVANDMNSEYRGYFRDYVGGWEILNVTDDQEYDVLTPEGKASWDRLCAIESIDTGSGVAKSKEAEFFGPGTQTRDNLVALRGGQQSRATELGLPKVYASDVSRSRGTSKKKKEK